MRSPTLEELLLVIHPEGPEPYRQPPFSTVRRALDQIDAQGPQQLSSGTLCADLEWFSHQQRALEAMSARWLAELDRRDQQAPDDPLHSPTLWLQDHLNLTPSAAYSRVRTARQLQDLPGTAAAFRRGELSSQHVDIICRAAEQAPRSMETPDVESMLLVPARRMNPQELLKHWQQLRYQADQEAGLAAEEEQRSRRWLYLRQTWGGSYRLEGQLDPEGGSILKTALNGLLGPWARDDERTPEQRRADGLVELASHRLDGGDLPEQGGERPHLTIVAELSTLRLEPGSRLAELDWGPLLTGESARRISCDADLTPVLVGPAGDVLYVGRRSRSTPTRLRKALNLRDRQCQAPGCTVPAERCQPHHRHHWADGGRTDLPNLRLCCQLHHARLHPENRRHREGADQYGPVQRGAP